MSINAADTALMYEQVLSNVTRADPIGYLCLSVSIPVKRENSSSLINVHNFPFNKQKSTSQALNPIIIVHLIIPVYKFRIGQTIFF